MKTRQSVIVAIAHDVLNVETFAQIADLSEAVKCRCARLHVPYDSGRISAALAVVARTRPLVCSIGAGVSRRAVHAPERTVEHTPVSRDEAAAILARLYCELERR